MSVELTDRNYWENYWTDSNLAETSYDLSKGLFFSYHMLFNEYIAITRERLGKRQLRIIDCGCGNGLMLRYLKESFPDVEVWGIEYTEVIHAAERTGKELELDFHLVKADMLGELPGSLKGTFDIAVSVGLIEHFERPKEVLYAIKGLLRMGGCMITIIPNFEDLYNVIWKTLDPRNYSMHIPISSRELLDLHRELGLRNIVSYKLGTPTIPGIHRPRKMWEKISRKISDNLNGRILNRLFRRQRRLSFNYPLAPIDACVGFYDDADSEWACTRD